MRRCHQLPCGSDLARQASKHTVSRRAKITARSYRGGNHLCYRTVCHSESPSWNAAACWLQQRILFIDFLDSVADHGLIERALHDLLDGMQGRTGITEVVVTLEQIQDAVLEQLSLFPDPDEHARKLRQIQAYLSMRFGASRLWEAALVHPDAPLAEWRVGSKRGEEVT
jgi:hypothetical protein